MVWQWMATERGGPMPKNKTRQRCCCMTHHTILCIEHAVDKLSVCTTWHAVGRKARRRHVPPQLDVCIRPVLPHGG